MMMHGVTMWRAGVGTVVKSTSGRFKEGQRVVSAGKWNGTWQEYALADESSLVRSSIGKPTLMDNRTKM